MHVHVAVFHSRVVYGFSNKHYRYCASARRPLDGTFKILDFLFTCIIYKEHVNGVGLVLHVVSITY